MSRYFQARPRLVATLRLGFSIVLVALLFYFVPFSQLRAALDKLPASVWLAVLAAYLLGHVVGILKWRMMVNLAGADLSYVQAARCYFGGLFGTLFFPSIVGGDVVRLSLALKEARSRTGAALACLLDRMIDLAALAIVALFGASLLQGTLDGISRRVFWGIAAAALILCAGVCVAALVIPFGKLPHRVRRIMAQMRQSWRAVLQKPQYVLMALVLGIAVQGWFVYLTAKVADFCGLHVAMHGWLLAWPLAKLSGVVPLTQGGIGVREVALAALLAPFGAKPALTVAVGMVWEAIIVVTSLLAGLFSFLLGRLIVSTQPTAQVRLQRGAPAPRRSISATD